MVVPSNRRSFLATLALAAGIGTPAIASPIIQSTENPEGLPVMTFDEKGQMHIDKSWIFNSNFKASALKPKCEASPGSIMGALQVWIPSKTPVMISDYLAEFSNGMPSSVIYGKAVLVKSRILVSGANDVDWYMLHACKATVIAPICNSFIAQPTIDLRSAKF